MTKTELKNHYHHFLRFELPIWVGAFCLFGVFLYYFFLSSTGDEFLSCHPSLSRHSKPRLICENHQDYAAAEADHRYINLTVGDKVLTVEIVTKPESLERGLSGRSQIGSDGMLFMMPSPRRPQFWMKEMLFGLDLIWISQGQVSEITPNVPAPQPLQPLTQLPHYSPQQPADAVLEVEAGKVAAWEIKIGDTVSFE
ncbi:MAG TPA: DUF192 domain-containing protein [Vitreimonas sp.]|nr:DUF192 domain-containing protein [Vitreimonas sp.]